MNTLTKIALPLLVISAGAMDRDNPKYNDLSTLMSELSASPRGETLLVQDGLATRYYYLHRLPSELVGWPRSPYLPNAVGLEQSGSMGKGTALQWGCQLSLDLATWSEPMLPTATISPIDHGDGTTTFVALSPYYVDADAEIQSLTWQLGSGQSLTALTLDEMIIPLSSVYSVDNISGLVTDILSAGYEASYIVNSDSSVALTIEGVYNSGLPGNPYLPNTPEFDAWVIANPSGFVSAYYTATINGVITSATRSRIATDGTLIISQRQFSRISINNQP